MIFYLLISCLPAINSLHFYLSSTQQRCFIEELSKDLHVQGVFNAEILNKETAKYSNSDSISVHITVEAVNSLQRIVDKTSASSGTFNFIASEYGEHVICVSTSAAKASWFDTAVVRFHLAFFYGDDANADHKKELLTDVKSKVKDLGGKIDILYREQIFQREREAEFRDLSERVNSKVVWWTIFQLFVLVATIAWQLQTLKTFFVSKKLV